VLKGIQVRGPTGRVRRSAAAIDTYCAARVLPVNGGYPALISNMNTPNVQMSPAHQGLKLVHPSAQLEPFLTQNTPSPKTPSHLTNTP
jgi:hypothetical protein